MIVEFIIFASIALALGFVGTWLLRPSLRRRIEAPKHAFQARLRAYNQDMIEPREDRNGRNDEHSEG